MGWGWAAALASVGAGLAWLGARAAPRRGLAAALPPKARQYAPAIERAARRHGVDPLLLAAVIEHESGYGELLTPRGPGGKGDGGRGHGVGQIDERTWGAWLRSHAWWDFETNATKAAEILAAGLQRFTGNLRAGVSAYNAGPGNVARALAAGKDPGSVTTYNEDGESYPDAVLRRLAGLRARAA